MTRLAFLADIHGNMPALEAVIADMKQFAPDHVIVAGDLINNVPYNIEVLACIRDAGWTAIRGNHEFYLLNHLTPHEPLEMRQSEHIHYLWETLQGKWFNTIAAMPDELTLYYPDAPTIRVTHGIPGKNNKAITPYTPEHQIHQWLGNVQETVFVSGHYHIGFERKVGQWQIYNPGPVGTPQDGNRQAGYLLLTAVDRQWQPLFRCVDYDFEQIEAVYRRENLIERTGLLSILAYLQVKYARPMINAYFDWNEATYGDGEVTLDRIQTFCADADLMWQFFGTEYQVNREGLYPITEVNELVAQLA